jgi:hypothetical protein
MWAFDIICDLHWLKECKGQLGEPSSRVAAFSGLLGAPIDVLFFSDESTLRHVRFVMHTADQALAQKCVNQNIMTWIDSIEAGVILGTRRSFCVPKLGDRSAVMTILGEYDGGAHVTAFVQINQKEPFLDPQLLSASVALWTPELRHHLFYFRRMIDPTFPLDQRWLYAYKLFEWHFAKQHLGQGHTGKKNELTHSQEWKQFVNGYQRQLHSMLRPKQDPFGLIEQVRAMVAHACLDERTDEEKLTQPDNLILLTFPTMRDMANDLLNGLKEPGIGVKLTS